MCLVLTETYSVSNEKIYEQNGLLIAKKEGEMLLNLAFRKGLRAEFECQGEKFIIIEILINQYSRGFKALTLASYKKKFGKDYVSVSL